MLAPAADLVDLVDEDDAVLLDRGDRLARHLLLVEQLVAFLLHQHAMAFGNAEAARLGATAAERLAEDIADIDHAHLRAGHAGNVERRELQSALILHLDLDLALVELAR